MHQQPESIKKLMRCSSTAFLRWLERHEGMTTYDHFDLNSEDEDGFNGGFFFARKSGRPKPTDKDDAIRNDLFLPEYSTVPGLPEIEGIPKYIMDMDEYYSSNDDDDIDSNQNCHGNLANKPRNLPLLDDYRVTKRPKNGLCALIDNNIKTLENVRSIYKKCNAIRNNAPVGGSGTASFVDTKEEQEERSLCVVPAIPSSSCDDVSSIEISQKATQQLMQQTVVQLLTHAGFEGTQNGPLNVITDLMSDYFSNIGKTVRSYWDAHSQDMTGEEILLHTLHENGVDKLEDLENYVADDIEKYGQRLSDLSRRLEDTYQDLVAGSIEKTVYNEADLFDTDEDAFTT